MSGFEIAGIVLGAFPLLQDAAKRLRVVFGDVKTWWRFETEFEVFISSIETEHIKYSLSLEILLSDLDVSDEDREQLQNDSTCGLWHHSPIQAYLRQRIQDRYYGWFMGQLNDINTALQDLHQILTSGKVSWFQFRLRKGWLPLKSFNIALSIGHKDLGE